MSVWLKAKQKQQQQKSKAYTLKFICNGFLASLLWISMWCFFQGGRVWSCICFQPCEMLRQSSIHSIKADTHSLDRLTWTGYQLIMQTHKCTKLLVGFTNCLIISGNQGVIKKPPKQALWEMNVSVRNGGEVLMNKVSFEPTDISVTLPQLTALKQIFKISAWSKYESICINIQFSKLFFFTLFVHWPK